MRLRLPLACCLAVGFLLGGALRPAAAQPLRLILPTSNDALLHGDGPSFYMYTDRYFQGVRSRPWQGGQYGFVRNAVDTPAGIVYTRFHEGLDVKPRYRDRNGEPLDTVRSVDAGRVVYVNDNPRESSYGRYVVVEHIWSGAPFYSLYAHLGRVDVRQGAEVAQGARLGRLGYTGRGIDRRRAHVHFEINMLLNADFDRWHAAHMPRSRNHHGLYNGLNLAGLDVAALYLALQEEPDLTIEDFLARQAPYYSVVVPNEGILDFQRRYPWLTKRYDASAPSLDVTFTQDGLPIRVTTSDWQTSEPVVAKVEPSAVSYGLVTRQLDGDGDTADLSRSGTRYLDLLARRPHPKDLAAELFPRPTPVVEAVALEAQPAEAIDTTTVQPEPRPIVRPVRAIVEAEAETEAVAAPPGRRVRGW